MLAISGGGSNGAYAAGLLCGWTASGSRPTFRVVTGVSVGALIAPLAFLGPAYDDRLVEMTRTASDDAIYARGTSRHRMGGGRPQGGGGPWDGAFHTAEEKKMQKPGITGTA